MNAHPSNLKQEKGHDVRISVVSNQDKEQLDQTKKTVNDIEMDKPQPKKKKTSEPLNNEKRSQPVSRGSGIYYVGDLYNTNKKQELDDYLLN